MYQVTFIKDIREQDYEVIHSPFINGDKLESGIISQTINDIDSFNLELTFENKGYGKMRPFISHIVVQDIKSQKVEFRGRVLDYENDMNAEGLHTQMWMCESELAYLHDSQQQHYEFRGTPLELFTMQVKYHNAQVKEEDKQFRIGKFEVTDPNDYMYLYLNAEETTFESIKRTIIDKLGGELQIRRVDGINYLDVVLRRGHDSEEDIVLSRNLMSVNQRIDPTEIITRLTPLGERIESEDTEATDASQERLTIKSVNNGVPYIDDSDLIAEFGIQGGTKTWDDVTTPERLLSNGRRWLENQKVVLTQYKVEALDLFKIGKGVEDFRTGNTHRLINPIMALDERIRIIGRKIDIVEPTNSNLTIGDQFKSLLDYQLEQQAVERRVLSLQDRLSRSSRQVYQLGAAYSLISQDIQGIQNVLENVDAENLPQHLQSIEDQLAAIQRELEQIEPPPSGGGDGANGGGSGIKYFPVDYTRSGINFWTGMQHDMGFGRRSSGDWHAGYDIGGGGTGHPVYAIASGTVTAASYVGGWGNRIAIEHSTDEYHTLYAHLASMDVVVGQTVEAGQRIGMMGASGGNYAIHLHVELSETGLFDDGNTIDPAPYLGVIADNTTSLPNPAK